MRSIATALALCAALFSSPAAAAESLFDVKLQRVANPFPPPQMPLDIVGPPGSRMSDHEGKVVVAVFWATWCHICLKEMPVIDELAADMGPEGVVVLPLSVDTGDDAEAKVAAYYEKNLIENLPVVIDPGAFNASAIGLRGTPTSFILNKEGLIVGAIEGMAAWDSDSARAYLRELLAE